MDKIGLSWIFFVYVLWARHTLVVAVCLKRLPLFRAVVELCSTNRLFTKPKFYKKHFHLLLSLV